LQSDGNVKKISGYITRKVADRLHDIFKNDRTQFEEKWDNLKIFIQYGMLSDEKFYERAEKFVLLKNTDNKYFTFEEYKNLVKTNQENKDGDLIYLYTTNKDEQYGYIEQARAKGYDILLMDGQLDVHAISQMEQKMEKTRFVRVDSDTVEKLIQKEENNRVTLTDEQRDALIAIFDSQIPPMEKANFVVTFEQLSPAASPVFVTQNEFMRRMKEMSAMQGGMMSFYGEMPDSYNLVVNTGHPIVEKLLQDENEATKEAVGVIISELTEAEKKRDELKIAQKDKKSEEIPAPEKSELETLESKINELTAAKREVYKNFAAATPQVGQLIDLALLANNMLKGEALAKFVKRSYGLM
jgi:molecular chaperone HtpG